MSDEDLPEPLEPHSGALPAVDPWATSDSVTGVGELPTVPGGHFTPLTFTDEPFPPAADAAKPTRSRLVRLSALGLAGCLLIGLLIGLLLPQLMDAKDDAANPPDNAPGQAGLAPTSVPAVVPTTPSSTAEPSSTPTTPPARTGQLKLRGFKMCLTGNEAGQQLILWTCNKHAYQQWTLDPDGSIRADDNLCMNLPYDATANYTKVQMTPCDRSLGQQFKLTDTDPKALKTKLHPGMRVDAENGKIFDGTPLVLFPCNEEFNQTWTFE